MMSRHKELLLWIFGTALSVALIMALAWSIEGYPHSKPLSEAREPASSSDSQRAKREALYQDFHASFLQGKPSPFVDVKIESPGRESAVAGEMMALVATIKAKQDLEGMRFTWHLPESGVRVIGGPLDGDLDSLQAGEERTLRLEIETETNENRQIHLHVYKHVDGKRMGKITQFNTVPDLRLKRQMRAKAEILEQMQKAGIRPHKLMQ